MDLNATLLGQMITFAVFVIFTMKYVWPPITKAMQEREKKIADGLAAGQKGEHDLQVARDKAADIVYEAKATAEQIISQARSRVDHIMEEGKQAAKKESERLIAHAYAEIEQQVTATKRQLQNQISVLALGMAEKIVQHDIDPAAHQKLLDKMVAEL
jgi:F-type H+-transporting ATPase subunit b